MEEPMPKKAAPLSDIEIKKAKPKDKDYKIADGGGLYLLVTPSGGKLWRVKYRFDGKEKTLYLLTLTEALPMPAKIETMPDNCWQMVLILVSS